MERIDAYERFRLNVRSDKEAAKYSNPREYQSSLARVQLQALTVAT
jgi:hypothetical protein